MMKKDYFFAFNTRVLRSNAEISNHTKEKIVQQTPLLH